MLKNFASFAAIGLLFSFAPRASAQALPTATARGELQAGAGFSYSTPDYGPKSINGFTGFADYDFGLHFGAEFDAHVLNLTTPTDIAENTYLAGPRFIYPYRRRINFYGKALLGVGKFKVLETQDNQDQYDGSYLAYSLGGGIDLRVSQHIVIRAIDFDYEKWPSYGRDGLTPLVYTFGVAYRIR